MNGLLTSLNPLLEKYKIELILIVLSILVAIVSSLIFLSSLNSTPKQTFSIEQNLSPTPAKRIFVDLAGAIEKPDIYEITIGARLKDILIKAGGLAANADRSFFSRNFNLAQVLNDQEKIYIPSKTEVEVGFVKEGQLGQDSQANKININTATVAELDTLVGVGTITAEKIIQGRPYKSVDDLVTKKILNNSTFEKIKDLVMTN